MEFAVDQTDRVAGGRIRRQLPGRCTEPPGHPLPPALASGALTLDFADELMLRELPQMITGGAAGFTEPFGQAAGGLRPPLGQLIKDPHPQRMAQCLQQCHIDRSGSQLRPVSRRAGSGIAGLSGSSREGVHRVHGTSLIIQNFICSVYFAMFALQFELCKRSCMPSAELPARPPTAVERSMSTAPAAAAAGAGGDESFVPAPTHADQKHA